MCKILRRNPKRLPRKQQTILGGYFFVAPGIEWMKEAQAPTPQGQPGTVPRNTRRGTRTNITCCPGTFQLYILISPK